MIRADLTEDLYIASQSYGAIVSADAMITDLGFYHMRFYNNAADERAGDWGLTACLHAASSVAGLRPQS